MLIQFTRYQDIQKNVVFRRSVTTVPYIPTTFQTACCLRYNRYAEGVPFVISSDERKFNPCGNKRQCKQFLYKFVGFRLSALCHQYSLFIILSITDTIYSQQLTASLNNTLTFRQLMSYIYIYIYIYMEHPFLMFLDHTQRRSTVGRTPLDE